MADFKSKENLEALLNALDDIRRGNVKSSEDARLIKEIGSQFVTDKGIKGPATDMGVEAVEELAKKSKALVTRPATDVITTTTSKAPGRLSRLLGKAAKPLAKVAGPLAVAAEAFDAPDAGENLDSPVGRFESGYATPEEERELLKQSGDNLNEGELEHLQNLLSGLSTKKEVPPMTPMSSEQITEPSSIEEKEEIIPATIKKETPKKKADIKQEPIKKQTRNNFNKIVDEAVKQGNVAPEDKKSFLQQLLNEYRASKAESKEKIETAAMYDAILNAARGVALAAGVDEKKLSPESKLEAKARANRQAELGEILAQAKTEKALKDLEPQEMTEFQKAQIELKKGEEGSRDPLSRQSIAYRSRLKQLAEAQYDDPKAVDSMMSSISGLSEYDLKKMKFATTMRSGDLGLTKAQAKRFQLQKTMEDKRALSKDEYRERRQEEREIAEAQKLKEKDYNRLAKIMERSAFGGRGGQKVLGTAIVKQRTIADGLDTIVGFKAGLIPTSQAGQELASILASVLKGGGTATESEVKGLMPETAKRKFADWKTWITSSPQEAMTPKMVDQFKKMLERENTFWSKKIRQQDKTLESMIRPILNRKDKHGRFVNKDLYEDWQYFMQTKQSELEVPTYDDKGQPISPEDKPKVIRKGGYEYRKTNGVWIKRKI
jgi:polyhydroxyalkanoate synthesis regulator phasin